MKTIKFHLNGEAREIEAWPDQPLLEVLREKFKLKSLKSGCSPQRECGACLALIDGQPKVTCAVRVEQVEGRSITTLEGVSDNERRLYADAFQAAAGMQCGFCTPGLVLRIKWITDQGQRLSRAEIARLIDGHLCRCTGYVKIIDAVELIQAGQARRRAAAGRRGRRRRQAAAGATRARELALGERPFVADIDAPGMLYGALVLSAHARARIVRDRRRQGARARRRRRGRDRQGRARRPLGRPDLRRLALLRRRGRRGALRRRRARRRRRRDPRASLARRPNSSKSNTSPCPPCSTPPKRIKPGAPQVNPKHDNLLSTTRYARGDVEAALAASAHVVSGVWTTQRIEHLFLEPEACLAEPLPDGRLHVVQPGPGHLRGSPADRRRPRRARGAALRRTRAERRRVRRQGGHDDPGADGAAGAPDRAAGADRAHPRGIDPHPSQAPPAHHDLHGGLRRGGPADRGEGRTSSAIPAPTPRSAARCSSAPPATPAGPTGCRRSPSRPSPPTPTIRRAARCAVSASTRPASPSRAVSTCSPPRSASTAGRCAGATSCASAT